MNDNRLRLNTRLPPILWKALRRLASQDGITHDQEVRKLIGIAGGVAATRVIPPKDRGPDACESCGLECCEGWCTRQDAPGTPIDRNTLLDPHQPIRRS